MDPRVASDAELLRLATARGLLSESQIEAARKRQQEISGTLNTPSSLSDILVMTGTLRAEQVADLRKELTPPLEPTLRLEPDPSRTSDLPEEVRQALDRGVKRVGRYIPVRLLGEGGMGVVWKAWDPQLSRWTALKLIKKDSGLDFARFQREARVLAKLENLPNVAPVYDAGEHEGQAFFVMKFVDGGNLSSHWGGKPAPWKEACAVLRDATRALGQAHRLGIIHRDIKPLNIMVDRSGQTYVMDFGLARKVSADLPGPSTTALTVPGAILGTPSFMSPEQALGRQEIGPASDVYSMGATLWALLAARPPHEATSIQELLVKVATQPPAPISKVRADLPAGVEALLARCLTTDPAKRFPDGEALSAALDELLRGEASALPIRKMGPLRALAAAAVLAVAFLSWNFLKPPRSSPLPPPVVDTTAKSEPREADPPKAPPAATAETPKEPQPSSAVLEVTSRAKELEGRGQPAEALKIVIEARVLHPQDADLDRLEQRLRALLAERDKAERERQYTEAIAEATARKTRAGVTGTSADWQAAVLAAGRAEGAATDDARKRESALLHEVAQREYHWSLAREAEAAGKIEDAIRMAEQASRLGPEPEPLAKYRTALAAKKKDLETRAQRKAEFDRALLRARQEPDPVKARAEWLRGLELADLEADRETVRSSLAAVDARIAEDARRKALAGAKAALDAGDLDRAGEEYAKLNAPPTEREAREGLAAVAAARDEKRYRGFLQEAQRKAEQGDWGSSRTALAEAAKLKPASDEPRRLLAEWEARHLPASIDLDLDPARELKVRMVRITPGGFTRGSREQGDERPPHAVTISRPFYLQTTEVTQAQWAALMAGNPSPVKGSSLPVTKVGWDDAASFCKAMNERVGRQRAGGGSPLPSGWSFDLPTEAEWEYACRAGSTARWGFGDDPALLPRHGWFRTNAMTGLKVGETTYSNSPMPAGALQANAWGLQDLHGNVWEWCRDWYGPYPPDAVSDPAGPASGRERVVRGGCFRSVNPQDLRAGTRERFDPSKGYDTVGFRLLLR